jgi:multidrug efflux pump subunit AcrB
VQVNYGGEAEKNAESFQGLAVSFLFALIGIFFILAIQFHSLSYPLIVMLAIPFGAVGIIVSFFLHDLFQSTPLSFFAALGFVALTGVVVNSSLVLLVFIQRAIKDGMEPHEAIVMAGRRRLRAVILTAGTTVMGLLPTAYGWGGEDPFVAPMALALAWGLVFATLLTLITIPAFLAAGLDLKAWRQRAFARLATAARARF